MLLKGKRALITGSTSGIGAQCARVLAGEGVSVIINGSEPPSMRKVVPVMKSVSGLARKQTAAAISTFIALTYRLRNAVHRITT